MNPAESSNHRRSNERNNINDDYHERFNQNQYYNAVEDEQIYMDEYTTLLHRYNDFIVNGNAMFTRMEQTLRENITRALVRQSLYYNRLNEMRTTRMPLATQSQPPARLYPTASVPTVPTVPTASVPTAPTASVPTAPTASVPTAPSVPSVPLRSEQYNRPRNTTSPQPQLPSAPRFGDVFPRLLSRYFTNELNRESREINNDREKIFSMLYTIPVAVRTNPNVAATAGAPTNDQINLATLNTVFSNIISPVNATCPISRDEFNDESEITMIRGCNHVFNRESLTQWFVNHSTCPMCRGDIRDYQPPPHQQSVLSQSHPQNLSIDRIDDNELTFSYDIPVQYNNDQIYRDILNTITGMAQPSPQNNNRHDDDDDDIMEVD
jgi:hypothetical protein